MKGWSGVFYDKGDHLEKSISCRWNTSRSFYSVRNLPKRKDCGLWFNSLSGLQDPCMSGSLPAHISFCLLHCDACKPATPVFGFPQPHTWPVFSFPQIHTSHIFCCLSGLHLLDGYPLLTPLKSSHQFPFNLYSPFISIPCNQAQTTKQYLPTLNVCLHFTLLNNLLDLSLRTFWYFSLKHCVWTHFVFSLLDLFF